MPISTSVSLVDLARQKDQDAWRQLCDIYSPLVFGWARRAGLQDADAADIVQRTFVAVAKNLARFRYEKPEDTFRGWLWTITLNEIRGLFRHRSTHPDNAVGGSGLELQQVADWVNDDSAVEEIESEEATEAELVRRAADVVKDDFEPRTWQAFWRSTVDGEPAAEIAKDLGLKANAVRQAKFRVLKRIREALG